MSILANILNFIKAKHPSIKAFVDQMRAIRAAQGEVAGSVNAEALTIKVPKPRKAKPNAVKAADATPPANNSTKTDDKIKSAIKSGDAKELSKIEQSGKDYEKYSKEFWKDSADEV